MGPNVLSLAIELAETIRNAHRRHAFETAVRNFVGLLATVPDYPPPDFSVDAIGALKTLAEDVIARIEQRLSANMDPDADQRELARGIYEIRRLLEGIDPTRHAYRPTP